MSTELRASASCAAQRRRSTICSRQASPRRRLYRTPCRGFPIRFPPTPDEIRRLAIFNDYSALIDTSPAGGFGLLASPRRNGTVFGREYLALARLPQGGPVFTVMAQIPQNFDVQHPMIMTAPSSGSRGIYGAISMAEWAFLKKCAVAYTDKGTAPGFHDLDSGAVYGLDGVRLPASSQDEAMFKVADGVDLEAYKRALPHRLAVKHAHSQANIEASWGQYVLASITFCLFCLNDWLGEQSGPFTRPTTKVIAAGVSNGGGSALRAAEQDDPNAPLIDAVVVSEPQIQPRPEKFAIRYGNTLLRDHKPQLPRHDHADGCVRAVRSVCDRHQRSEQSAAAAARPALCGAGGVRPAQGQRARRAGA